MPAAGSLSAAKSLLTKFIRIVNDAGRNIRIPLRRNVSMIMATLESNAIKFV